MSNTKIFRVYSGIGFKKILAISIQETHFKIIPTNLLQQQNKKNLWEYWLVESCVDKSKIEYFATDFKIGPDQSFIIIFEHPEELVGQYNDPYFRNETEQNLIGLLAIIFEILPRLLCWGVLDTNQGCISEFYDLHNHFDIYNKSSKKIIRIPNFDDWIQKLEEISFPNEVQSSILEFVPEYLSGLELFHSNKNPMLLWTFLEHFVKRFMVLKGEKTKHVSIRVIIRNFFEMNPDIEYRMSIIDIMTKIRNYFTHETIDIAEIDTYLTEKCYDSNSNSSDIDWSEYKNANTIPAIYHILENFIRYLSTLIHSIFRKPRINIAYSKLEEDNFDAVFRKEIIESPPILQPDEFHLVWEIEQILNVAQGLFESNWEFPINVKVEETNKTGIAFINQSGEFVIRNIEQKINRFQSMGLVIITNTQEYYLKQTIIMERFDPKLNLNIGRITYSELSPEPVPHD